MSPSRNWDSPTPLSPASVTLPPEPGGGAHSPAGEGLGESQFRRLEKKLSTLPTLCPGLYNSQASFHLDDRKASKSYHGLTNKLCHLPRGLPMQLFHLTTCLTIKLYSKIYHSVPVFRSDVQTVSYLLSTLF